MKRDVYVDHARYILWQAGKLTVNEQLSLAALGLVGEFAEYKESLALVGTNKAKEKPELELGDFLWYVHLMCLLIGDNFKSQVTMASKQMFGTQRAPDPVKPLGTIAEHVKKIAVTKKKKLDDERRESIAHAIQVVLRHAFYWVPTDVKVEDIILLNLEKCEERNGKVPDGR